jgi:hypothetical protein
MPPKARMLAALAVAICCVVACAQVAGLPGYSSGEEAVADGSVPTKRPTTGSDATSGSVTYPSPDATTYVGDDGDDGSLDLNPYPGSDDAGDDGEAGIADAHAGEDATSTPPNDAGMAPDVYVCGPGTCGGCCDNGTCVGGLSVGSCGSGGAKCKDCTSTGACSSAGACTTPVPDAAPPPQCTASACASRCALAPIQGGCCKLDNTCGCQFTIFDPCM